MERILGDAGYDRAPWLVVAYGAGIAAWFGLPTQWHWLGLVAACLAISLAALVLARAHGAFPYLRAAGLWLPLFVAAGCLTAWGKSALAGEEAIARPEFATLSARVLEREERPAEDRIRLIVAARTDGGEPRRMRLNLPEEQDSPQIAPGAVIQVRARLMPPAPPMLPGGYNFARTAWFSGLAATGTVAGPVAVIATGETGDFFGTVQTRLARHVRSRLEGSAGEIAATLASGDRGGIAEADVQAMRDSGLAHLLSISGLHVSAVIGTIFFATVKLLALWPWLALRVRLPIMAAAAGALAGIGYTLLTGAEVPTVRSCIGAVLVLLALVLGREALSLRLLAVAAFLVLLFWPESLVGPSFQMSFAAVTTIIALSRSGISRRFLVPREESWFARPLRYMAMLFATSLLIEIVLTPIALFHFHRSGIYGAFANLFAIPLTTIVVMPLIALALFLDLAGLGAPAWWLTGKALDAMLAMARFVASRPGAVTSIPAMGVASYIWVVSGGLWLALWQSRIRWFGLVPAFAGILALVAATAPDLLVSGDGRHVGVTGQAEGELLVLRDSRSSFASDNLVELAGMSGATRTLANWPGARCSRDFCMVSLRRGGKIWQVLMARSRERVPERALAAACARADIVIADRWLPYSCQPRWLKADRRMLDRTGGLAIDLEQAEIRTVAQSQGQHGWWRGAADRDRTRPAKAPSLPPPMPPPMPPPGPPGSAGAAPGGQ